MTANTTTNPTTGVEYYTDGPLERQSVKLYVPVVNGQVLNQSGVRWPVGGGGVHDEAADYYERLELAPVSFDPKIFKIDFATSGWGLHPKRNAEGEFVAVPDGHPKGTYKETQNVVRRSMDELKTLVKGYCDRFNLQIWQRLPQDIWSIEKLAYAKDQIAKGNSQDDLVGTVQDDALLREKLVTASLHNDARLAQLYAEIEAAGETGAIDFIADQMATLDANGEQLAGWVNGIPE
jgi:hypothetical protein